MYFEMQIEEIFGFNDGQTVFSGKVLLGPLFIKKCRCDLYSNDVKVETFDLEGEMMPLRKGRLEARSVSTFHPFSKKELRKLTNLKLISHL